MILPLSGSLLRADSQLPENIRNEINTYSFKPRGHLPNYKWDECCANINYIVTNLPSLIVAPKPQELLHKNLNYQKLKYLEKELKYSE